MKAAGSNPAPTTKIVIIDYIHIVSFVQGFVYLASAEIAASLAAFKSCINANN